MKKDKKLGQKGFALIGFIIVGLAALAVLGLYIYQYYLSGEEGPILLTENSWKKVQKAGVLKIGTSLGDLPWGDIDPDSGEMIGAEIEIAKLLAEELGVNPEIVNVGWDYILDDVLSKKYDVAIAGISITPERAEKVAFSKPYYTTGQTLIVRSTSGIKEVDDLRGKTVGVLNETTSEEYARTLTGLKEIKTYDQLGEYFKDLRSGVVDVVIYDAVAGFWYQKTDLSLKLTGGLLTEENYGIALRKEDASLLRSVNKAIDEIIESDKYQEIIKTWYGE